MNCGREHSFRKISEGTMYNILEFDPEGEQEVMPSAEYVNAKKEFRNCLLMSIFGLGVPIVIAFREWLPIMRAEKAKAQYGTEDAQVFTDYKELLKLDLEQVDATLVS